MVQGDGEPNRTRMYLHRSRPITVCGGSPIFEAAPAVSAKDAPNAQIGKEIALRMITTGPPQGLLPAEPIGPAVFVLLHKVPRCESEAVGRSPFPWIFLCGLFEGLPASPGFFGYGESFLEPPTPAAFLYRKTTV